MTMMTFKRPQSSHLQRPQRGHSLRCVALSILALSSPACAEAGDHATALAPKAFEFAEGEARYVDALALVDQRIDGAETRADAQPNSWMPLRDAAVHWQGRARLRGGLHDYIQAEAAMQSAFERAPEGGGPWFEEAQLAFTLHRLDEAEAALDEVESAVLVDDPTRAAALGLRGDIALQRGDMSTAWQALQAAEELDPTSRSLARLALWHWRSGELDIADDHFARAAQRYHGVDPAARAWFELQRGLIDLDRGELDAAFDHYIDANDRLSGYYLIEEHVAEVLVGQGRLAEALFVYEDIVQRTGAPEFMDALAELHASVGDLERSEAWQQRAKAAYTEQLDLLPDAAVGHALDHYLTFGPVETALDLAQANFDARPHPHAEAALALALAQAQRSDEARSHIESALAGEWRSFDLDADAARVYGLIGDTAAARAAQIRACERAPLRCEEIELP